jgi:hypothetical protein
VKLARRDRHRPATELDTPDRAAGNDPEPVTDRFGRCAWPELSNQRSRAPDLGESTGHLAALSGVQSSGKDLHETLGRVPVPAVGNGK